MGIIDRINNFEARRQQFIMEHVRAGAIQKFMVNGPINTARDIFGGEAGGGGQTGDTGGIQMGLARGRSFRPVPGIRSAKKSVGIRSISPRYDNTVRSISPRYDNTVRTVNPRISQMMGLGETGLGPMPGMAFEQIGQRSGYRQ